MLTGYKIILIQEYNKNDHSAKSDRGFIDRRGLNKLKWLYLHISSPVTMCTSSSYRSPEIPTLDAETEALRYQC